jgi:hypothetical protein
MAGVQTAAIKICDGFKVLGGLEPLFQTLRNHGIKVGAWGYSYLNRAPLQEAHVIADACHRYTPDFYLIDVEIEVEGNFGGSRMFLNELRPATAGLPLGLNSFWNVRLHPKFPWIDYLNNVDFVCPQVYGHGSDPVGKLILSQQSYAEIPNAPEVPMSMVAGDMHTFRGMRPTPEQVTQFLSAADADPFIQGVIMWAADDTQTPPDLWQTFSQYQWNKDGRTIPEQPLGWGKVRTGGGLWVRSSPRGAKVAMAKGELAPIWSVSDTKWSAITKVQTSGFSRRRTLVETTMDLRSASSDAAERSSTRPRCTRAGQCCDGIGGGSCAWSTPLSGFESTAVGPPRLCKTSGSARLSQPVRPDPQRKSGEWGRATGSYACATQVGERCLSPPSCGAQSAVGAEAHQDRIRRFPASAAARRAVRHIRRSAVAAMTCAN